MSEAREMVAVEQCDMDLADAIAAVLKPRGVARILVAGNVDLLLVLARHRAAIAAALSTSTAPAAEDGWQPIETAPKDGTWVLLGGGALYDQTVEPEPRPVVAHWSEGYKLVDQAGWFVAGFDSGMGWLWYHNPTHWCPLPAALAKGGDAR